MLPLFRQRILYMPFTSFIDRLNTLMAYFRMHEISLSLWPRCRRAQTTWRSILSRDREMLDNRNLALIFE